jgi:hypothetical protein
VTQPGKPELRDLQRTVWCLMKGSSNVTLDHEVRAKLVHVPTGTATEGTGRDDIEAITAAYDAMIKAMAEATT